MSALVNPLTGVDATRRTPGNYAEIVFAQGPSSAAAGVREVVFVMPKISSGTWTAATLYPVRNTATAELGGGAGSPIHRAIRKFLSVNKNAKIWALPVAETVTGSPVAATWVLTLATTATATGTLSVTIAGELCQFTFASADTPTVIGDGIVAAINAKTWLPCTAVNVSGVVTVTAKLKGTSQGTASLGIIRARAEITASVGTTASAGGAFLGSGVAGAEGTTTEAANTTTALVALDSVRKYYIVTSATTATSLALFKTHITTKSEPRRGLRSVAIAAYTGSLATGSTIATGLNYERIQIAWQPNSDHDCAEIAGAVAAIRQKQEQIDSSYNFNGTSLNGILLPAYSTADWPDGDDIEDAIIDGLTPIASSDSGAALVQSNTTRSKNAAGTVDDSRVARTNKVSTPDEFTDTLLVRYALNYGNKKFKDDERLSDGSINPNQRLIRDVVRPSMITATIAQLMDEFDDAGLCQELAAMKESISVVKSPASPGRAESGLDFHTIDWLDQITTRVAEVSTG